MTEEEIPAQAVEEAADEAGKRIYLVQPDQRVDSRIHERNTFAVDAFYFIYEPTHTFVYAATTYLHSSGDLTLHEGVWELGHSLAFYGCFPGGFVFVFPAHRQRCSIGVVAFFKLNWMDSWI
jgi:hypothetical protein